MFVAVAVFLQRGYGEDGDGYFDRGGQDYDGGDHVPDIFGDDVGGEEVEFVERVGLFR